MVTDRSATLPLAEAAERLGISDNALRLRIRRGLVDAHKHDGRWHVVVPDRSADQAPDRSGPVADQVNDHPPTGPGIDRTQELIDRLTSQVAFLERELETRTDELQRRDVLLREALGRIPQLPSGEGAVAPRTEPSEAPGAQEVGGEGHAISMRREWWRFWKR